ncbi:MAG: hypothetical protein Q8L27_02295 [archaeon]|nr:hypothetical protein [archaeon]
MTFEPTHIKLERMLQCKVRIFEGIEAFGVKMFWNLQDCTYRGRCTIQEFREKHQPKPCLYNPKMFKCPAYHYYSMPLLLCERNP